MPSLPSEVVLVLAPEEAIGSDAATVRGARTVLVELDPAAPPDAAGFAARRTLAALRGETSGATLGVIGPSRLLEALLDRGLAAYVDVVVGTDLRGASAARWKHAHAGLQVWSTIRFRSFAELIPESAARPAGVDAAALWPPTTLTPGWLAGLRAFANLFPAALVPIPDSSISCQPAAACGVSTYQRADTLAIVAWIRRRAPGPLTVALSAPRAEVFVIARATDQASAPDALVPLAPALADSAGIVRIGFEAHGPSDVFVRVESSGGRVSEQVRVVGARQLTADEIVARHQAAAARQARLIRTLTTEARTTVTFEVPAFPAPVTVQADTTFFQGEGPTRIAQRNVTINGVAFSRTNLPRLPIIEPARAAAPPLAITLTRAYRYRLEGRERVRGREAYVLGFEPAVDGRSLFQGRAWIDADTFALLRLDAVQTNLRGPITSSQQIDEFAPERVAGETVWLRSRSEIRQVYQGAGVTTPVQRIVEVHRHVVNDPGFLVRRAAEPAGALMLVETDEGLRYDGRGRASRFVTLAGGALIDPNISHPLPFAGVNYTDFDLFGAGVQLNAFFGGAYGQFALSVPSLAGTRWQLAGAGFAMLARYNDRSFRAGRERDEENLRQRPAHLRAGVIRPLTSRETARAEYEFEHVALERGESTAASFVAPPDQVVHALRLAVETQRAGWRIEAWWSAARRAGWRAWGRAGTGDYDRRHADFQRAGVTAYRPWVLSPHLLARAEGAWMTGRDLDRFSRYAFGTFDNRLRGYPSASIRYDRGGVLRGALVWQPGGRLRVDGFADAALVREPGFGDAYRGYPGLGAALEAPAPFGLLTGVEWGYGIKGLNTDGTPGTHVVRITAYKVF